MSRKGNRDAALGDALFDKGPRGIVSRFVYAAIAPVVKIAMRFGMSAREFGDLVRWVYVKVFYSTPEFWQHGHPTIVQCAVKTGLPRTHVKAMHVVPEPYLVLFTQRQNLAYRVIEGWVSDPEFHDAAGRPAPLPIRSSGGPSFNKLFMKYGNDVPMTSVLGDLKQVGCVTVEKKIVTLVNQTYGRSFLDEDRLLIAAYMHRRFGETTDHNFIHSDLDDRRLQRLWWEVLVPEEVAPVAARRVQDELIGAARRINRLLVDYCHSKPKPDVQYVEVGFGAYAYQDAANHESLIFQADLMKRSKVK